MQQSCHNQKFNIYVLAISIVFAFGLTLVTPPAAAHDRAKALEQEVLELKKRLISIQDELSQIRNDSSRVEQQVIENKQAIKEERIIVQQKIEEEKEVIKKAILEESPRHMIFFRGGWARQDHHHNGISVQSNVAPVGAQQQAPLNAWYVGAGFDFGLTKNTWGLIPKTEIIAELMFEYKQFGTVLGNALANEPTQLAGGEFNPRHVTSSTVTVSAAPKIKFLEGYRLRPWIIPAGLAIHIISPPSETITFFQPAVMFAAGADYKLWKNMVLGVDARYHLMGGHLDGLRLSGLTLGGYLGIGF